MSDSRIKVAVFGIIKNIDGAILFQKRKNTGFADGYFQLPSGHIETTPCESITEWCMRELEEELWIIVKENDLDLVFCHHSYGKWTQNYLGFFFDVQGFDWDIKNIEPEKCEFLEWIHPRDFRDKKIIKYVKENLLSYKKGVLRCEQYRKKEDFLW